MNRTLLIRALLVPATLTACSSAVRPSPPSARLSGQGLSTDLETRAAWGQRVTLPVGAVNVRRVTVNGRSVEWTKVGSQVVFALPVPPAPTVPPQSVASYTDRAAAVVNVYGLSATTPAVSRTWMPYGAVVPGEVNVLSLNAGCPAPGEPDLTLVNRATAGPLCFQTLNIGQRDTAAALDMLRERPGVLAVSRNVLFSLDQIGGSLSYDPGCDQTSDQLDPGAQPYTLIQGNGLTSLVGKATASSGGSGVTVAVIGGGVTPAALGASFPLLPGINFVTPGQPPVEAFSCDFDRDGVADLKGHDTFVASLIHTIAPQARILPLKTCDALGDCRSAYTVMALLALLNPPYSGRAIANVSSGGPLGDPTLYALLGRPELADPSRFLLVASAGNLTLPVPHYPAGYAPGAAPPGSRANVLAVGAFGQTSAGVLEAATFNTGLNAEVLAPGINVCPVPAAQFRCTPGAAYPDNLGLTGTSYAAPFVTAVAALYAGSKPGRNLRSLILSHARLDIRGAAVGRVQFIP